MAAAEQEHDLDYYADHPEEMTAEMLAKLSNGVGLAGEDVVVETEDGESVPEVVAAPAPAPAPTPAPAPAPEPKTEQTPPGEQAPIATKDGKNQIPYSVLEGERTRARQAEQEAQRLRDEMAQLRASQAPAAAPAAPAPAARTEEDVEAMTDEELQEFAQDFPVAAKQMRSLNARLNKAIEVIGQITQHEGQRQRSEAVKNQQTTQQLIDANPKLAHLQANDRDIGWKAAVEIDDALARDPRNKDLSLAQRFEKVVSAYEAIHGPIAGVAAPAAAPTPAPAPAAKAPTQAPAPAQESDAVKTARKIIADAEAAAKNARSLSEIPGGVPPETNPMEQLGAMSATEIGNRMMEMSEKDLKALLAKAG